MKYTLENIVAVANDLEQTATETERRGLTEAVWAALEGQLGFSEELRQARHDLAESRGTPWSEVRRER